MEKGMEVRKNNRTLIPLYYDKGQLDVILKICQEFLKETKASVRIHNVVASEIANV